MPRGHYYASTSRIEKDVVNYLTHPLTKTLTLLATRDPIKADVIASLVATAMYGGVTASFHGMESETFDKNARMALAAELGKRPQDIKLSDYLESNNSIIRREIHDLERMTRLRYATDAVALIPAVLLGLSKMAPALGKIYENGRLNRANPSPDAPVGEMLLGAFNLWDYLIFATKSIYWAGETFFVPKTGHYEVIKLDENIQSVGKQYSANDIIPLINRNREDQKLRQIENKSERAALWPVLQKVADKLNTDPEFGMPEVIYLVGLNKLNIFELDEQGHEKIDPKTGDHIICKNKTRHALEAIDEVAEKGLARIAEEKAAAPESARIGFTGPVNIEFGGQVVAPEKTGFVERVRRGWMDFHNDLTTSMVSSPKFSTEYISRRDPGEPTL